MKPDSGSGDLFPWEMPESQSFGAAAASAPDVAESEPDTGDEPVSRRDPADGRADERAGSDRGGRPRAGGAGGRDRTVAPREYYSISEVCEIVGLKPHVLRYWETQFPPLSPSKNRSGNRVYQRKEIKLIMLVKKLLYQEKYTVEGARAKLEQLRRTGRMKETAGRALRLDAVELLRTELETLREILSAPTKD